ncbi:MAG TPA: hypothetical protein VG266_01630, partial [Candidatus Dormibacteraeota bacterium]|nr:hypothetical protein [Candidatus Dormibacteraeota bacterium]
MTTPVCRVHYRAAVAECPECHGGLCHECATGAASVAGLCRQCSADRLAMEDLEEVRREARLGLRRSGINVRRRHGDPVVLWRGPLRLALPAAGGVAVIFGAGVAAAEAKLQGNVDVAVSAVALALFVGITVRLLFGGVSRIAGIAAAAIYALAILCGQWFAGSSTATRSVVGLSRASEWVLAHEQAAIACYLVAGALAYAAA